MRTKAPIRIVIADDHEIFREGIAGMVRNNPEIELVDQASNGRYLLAQVSEHKPDVVLTDVQMDEMGGVEATRIICQRFPATSVIAMSMYDDNYTIMEMLKAGAIGYLVKNSGKAVVIEAIKAAFAGENYYCKTSSQKISALIASGRFDPKRGEFEEFTATEIRIIKMLCEERDNRQIAEELNLAVNSISKYRSDILSKAGVSSTTGLILYAIRNGIYKL